MPLVRSIKTKNTLLSKLPNIILSLIVCQIGKNIKPFHSEPIIYYFVTYVKFCILVVVVMIVEILGHNADENICTKKAE